MSGWQVGDLALCLNAMPMNRSDRCLSALSQLRVGGIYTVAGVGEGGSLFLEGITAGYEDEGYGWDETRFRKIKPDTEGANEDDAAWLKDLLSKPKVQA